MPCIYLYVRPRSILIPLPNLVLPRWPAVSFVVMVLLLGAAMADAQSAQDAPANDIIYGAIGPWNGKKIYLSPARHADAGYRGECFGTAGLGELDENTAAYRYAYFAATGNYIGPARSTSNLRNLRSRGYRIRIGRGTLSSAISRSNAWGATLHIPIHSNARSEDCYSEDFARHGTRVIFYSYGLDGGEGLADGLAYTVGIASPGTNDSSCHNSSACTRFNCLAELCSTKAVAAYLEREFHTWNVGASWLREDPYHAWRLGWAVDQFLDYP